MFSERMLMLHTLNDYTNNKGAFSYSTTLLDETFTYDDQSKTVTFKKIAGSGAKAFTIPIMNLYKDDIVEVELELKYNEGNIINILLMEQNSVPNINNTSPITQVGEWERVKVVFLATKDTYINNFTNIQIGYNSSKGGSYSIRNVSVKIKSHSNNFREITNKGVASCIAIKRPNANFLFEATCQIDENFIMSISGNDLMISFPTMVKRPSAIAQCLGYANGNNYNAKIVETSTTYTKIGFFNVSDNAKIPIINIPTTDEIWVNIFIYYEEKIKIPALI